ncbi:MAG: M56 family metallopeptidase [Pirellulales bacterium]
MSFINRISDQWLSWAFAVSWQLALLVCVVAIIAHVVRPLSPRVRYVLWLLVLVKVFLPPGLTAPWSVGRWGVAPLLEQTSLGELREAWSTAAIAPPDDDQPTPRATAAPAPLAAAAWPRPAVALATLWCAGCLAFWALVAWRYVRLNRVLRSAAIVDEGPLRVALERAALAQGLRDAPELLLTELVTSPFLLGVIRPRIVLPAASIAELEPADLETVLTHELVHWQRRDTWVGWMQVLAQGLLWFHPLLWWANRQLRHERECVCDEGVLRQGQIAPHRYGELIVRVLTTARARSLVGGSLVGVFEQGAYLQNRLEEIMNFAPKRRFGWPARVGLLTFALLFLPMAPGVMKQGTADDQRLAANDNPPTAAETSYPQIVKSVPDAGATGVPATLTQITVTFDRDMQGGMSWTGGPPLFPPVDESRQPRWIDKRTCALPVKLEKGNYYCVGINSTSYQNFKSADGVPVPSSAVYFATQGASAAVNSRVRTPKVVSLSPANGASDVDPTTKSLRVKFNVPMDEGMSWTGGGEYFPDIPEDQQAKWSKDGQTCTLPVRLEADHEYRLGLNSLSHINFQSKWGVPLSPVVYTFRTAKAEK